MTLEIVTSDLLAPVRHGFFTRRGGASSGIFAGLNCGQGSSDQAEIVEINRSRVAEAMGVALDHLVTVHQVHSPDVLVVDPKQVSNPADAKPKADAMVSATPGITLGILTADCQPVLFSDPGAGVIGAAHAGWRGAVDGVLQNTVDAMVDLGADRANIRAVIGPCISQPAYEVGPELRDTFLQMSPENARFFIQGAGDRFQFDLPAFGLQKLQDAGVKTAAWTRHCTYSDPDRFYSYRRTTHQGDADYGRLIACIGL